MNSAPVIALKNLGKSYIINHQSADGSSGFRGKAKRIAKGFKARIVGALRQGDTLATANQEEFWALRNISFTVPEGQALGIIGANGAGKSTLLKLLSRITTPSEGKIGLRGRVASLLEVGTGFNPELTGRENIFLNGAILGMRHHEVRRKFDEIIDFAGVERFLDTPLKRYSSGMRVRLGFAVAAHLEPEILVVDEVLAVGDIEFQKKCLGKMNRVASNEGRTVLFVSHNMGSIRQLCQRVIVLKSGGKIYDGSTEGGVDAYLAAALKDPLPRRSFPEEQDLPVQLREIAVLNEAGDSSVTIPSGAKATIEMLWQFREPIRGASLALVLKRDETPVLCTMDTDENPDADERKPGFQRWRVTLPTDQLKEGVLSADVYIGGRTHSGRIYQMSDAIDFHLLEVSEAAAAKGFAKDRPGILRVSLAWERD